MNPIAEEILSYLGHGDRRDKEVTKAIDISESMAFI